MSSSVDRKAFVAKVKLRYTSHPAWKRASIVGSFGAVVILWVLTLSILLGFVSISTGITENTVRLTMMVSTIALTIVAIFFGIKMFQDEEKDVLEISDNGITFKIVKSKCRKLSSVSIPFREMAFVELITPSAEESPMARRSLVLHDTNEQLVTVPIWTMTNNVVPILDFLESRQVRVVALDYGFPQLSG